MKKLLILAALVALPSLVSAQTITCSVSGASAKQATQYAAMLAKINAERAAASLPTYAGFPQHCAGMMLDALNSWINAQNQADADKAAAAAKAHGDETAITAHCTAAGLGAGCTKSQVACFVLTGNTACN